MVELRTTGELPVGKFLGAHDLAISQEYVSRYLSTVAEEPSGSDVAPALIACQEPWRFAGWYPAEVRGNLHIRQEWNLWQPLLVGGDYRVTALVADRYVRRDRYVIVNEVMVTDAPSGAPCCRGRTHQAFLSSVPEGDVVERSREADPARRFEVGAGDVVERVEGPWVELTPERCLAITEGRVNYHSDREVARSMGFPEVVVQGVFNLNLISVLMTRRFGLGWPAGGKCDVRFVNVIWGGDTVRACLALRSLTPEGSRQRAECEVWVEKRSGTVTAVGTASAPA